MLNLSTKLYPLNQLLQKEKEWQWTKQCEEAFQEAKKALTSEEVLTHYNPAVEIRLACDASPYGIGAVISHVMPDGRERPIAFASRSLSSAERNYAQIDREALGLVWGVKKFGQYLYGRKFTLLTDHKPLTSIFSPKKGIPEMAAAHIQRWALFLGAHNYDVLYKGTNHHANADGLSRLPLELKHAKQPEQPTTVDMFNMSQVEKVPCNVCNVEK